MTITNKRVIITGAAGQDGLLLGRMLAKSQNIVLGIVISESQRELARTYNPDQEVITCNSLDSSEIEKILVDFAPDFVFHLGAKSSVADSWRLSKETLETNIFVTLNWLNALKKLKLFETRFYNASSSEMFGLPEESPQNEKTLLHPRSPYGVSKVAAHHLVINFRESYGQFASTGILFNHESPLRTPNFVTKKISQGVAAIGLDKSKSITLGNLNISRDWGWAPDYVEGMMKIANYSEPDDFVLATGVSHTLEELLSVAFEVIGVRDWSSFVKIDQTFYRPADVVDLVGDSSKAHKILSWQTPTNFKTIVENMVEYDLQVQSDVTTPMWQLN
jgi:GDPmannose 4,6-dehydratase